MADNITQPLTSGGGETIATDEISGVHYQRSKLVHGGDGVNDGDVSTNNPLPAIVEPMDVAHVDGMGRYRSSNTVKVFDHRPEMDVGRLLWEDKAGGSATFTHGGADDPKVTLTVTASASDIAQRQTRAYMPARHGSSMLCLQEFLFGAAVAGVDRRVGLFDTSNGIALEQNSTTAVNLVRRSKQSGTVADTKTAKASWNIDPMDGTGRSGVTLDLTKTQTLAIEVTGGSTGRIRAGFFVDGKVFWAHQWLAGNTLAVASMSTGFLPLRYEIDSDGTNGASMQAFASSVVVDGETGAGVQFAGGRTSALASVTARVPVYSIRPKLTLSSIENRGLISPIRAVVNSDTNPAAFEIVYGGTLTGASFASVNADSIVEEDTAATAISGGVVVGIAFADQAGSEIRIDPRFARMLPIALDLDGAHPTTPYTDILTVTATAGTSTGCLAALEWTEHR